MAKQTLDQWIREAIIDEEKDGKCTSFALVHMRSNVEKEIHAIKLGDKKWDPKNLAQIFRGKAEGYSEELPGMQNFQLHAFYANRNEPQASKPFMVKGYTEMDGLATESPTGGGLVQQAMRHMEVLMQTTVRQTGTIFEMTNRTLEALTISNTQLRNENRDAFEVVKELIMQQADNRHRYRMEELSYQRSSNERKALMQAAPALVNSLTGREVFPQNSNDTALVEMLIEHLSTAGEEKLMKLTELGLPPAVMATLMTRFSAGLKERQLVAHARQGNGMDPEDDVTGGPLDS